MSSAVHSAATRDAVLGLRTARARSGRTPTLAPLLAVGLGFLLHLAAPVPLPVDETLAPPLLERTFALLFLVAAVLGFSTVERLFRRDSLPVLVRYPVDTRWVTRERATRIASDTGLLVALVACALLPEFLARGLVPEVFATAAFLALAVPVLFGATFGGAMFAIGTVPAPGTSPTARARSFDLAAPAALAASSLLLLILELGVAEPLRSLRDTGAARVQRSAWLAVGLSLFGALALARRGVHAYRSRFFQLGALFEEAERYSPPIASDRFESEYQRASRWDRGLDPVETEIARVLRLYLARLHGPARFATGALSSLLLLVALIGGARSTASLGLTGVLLVWLVLGVRSASRLERAGGTHPHGALPALAPSAAIERARRRVLQREIGIHATLLLPPALVLAVRGVPAALFALALGMALAAELPRRGLSLPRQTLVVVLFLPFVLALASAPPSIVLYATLLPAAALTLVAARPLFARAVSEPLG